MVDRIAEIADEDGQPELRTAQPQQSPADADRGPGGGRGSRGPSRVTAVRHRGPCRPFGLPIKEAGTLSLLISLPTMLVGLGLSAARVFGERAAGR
jgi:hypothetical protein